jgi:2-polyprenyl-3-methyl-5-hydroxy-6-metoxy-1,4-benzoquinol methylase
MIKTEFTPCPLCGQNEYKVVSKGNDFELNSSDDEYQFVECNKCGLLRLNPRPVQEELKKIYPQNYSCYQIESFYSPLLNKIRIALQKRFIRIIKKYAIENATILDVGCGSGELLSILQKYGEKDWHLAGNDINFELKTHLNKKGIDFFPGRFEDLNIGKWDVIIMQGVIEHLSNVDIVIKSMSRMLSDSGILIIITPDTDCWDRKIFEKKYWGQWHYPRHWTLYNPNNIKQHFFKHNIEVIKNTPMLSPWSWIRSLENKYSQRKYPKFVGDFFSMNNIFLISFFTLVNIIQVSIIHRSANMLIVAKKQENNYAEN